MSWRATASAGRKVADAFSKHLIVVAAEFAMPRKSMFISFCLSQHTFCFTAEGMWEFSTQQTGSDTAVIDKYGVIFVHLLVTEE